MSKNHHASVFALLTYLTLALSLLAIGLAFHNYNNNDESKFKSIIVNNPQLVIDAIESWNSKQLNISKSSEARYIRENNTNIFTDNNGTVFPSANTVVEFIDYNCGYCKSSFIDVEEYARSKSVHLVIKQLPILSEDSKFAARMALAAMFQGKFDQVNQDLIREKAVTNDIVLKVLYKNKVDVKRAIADADSGKVKQIIHENLRLAKDMSINGTPGFVIGSRVIRGYEKGAIHDAINMVGR